MKNEFVEKTVYIASPKRLFNTPIFHCAIAYVKWQGAQKIVDPSKMFKSNQEWKASFPDYLQECDVILIVTDNGIVGKGVYVEYSDFFDRYCKAYIFTRTIQTKNNPSNKDVSYYCKQIESIQVTDENDWTNYAIVHY